MSTIEFYAARAAQCRAEADSTKLVNVRARCLTAAFAFDLFDDQAAAFFDKQPRHEFAFAHASSPSRRAALS